MHPHGDETGSDDAERFVRRIHAEHVQALFAWANRRFADGRDAEEVIAESFVKAWRHSDQFDPDRGSERAWIFGIVRNTAADHYRRTGRHLRLIDSSKADEPIEPISEVEALAEATIVHDALMNLTEHHREVIVEAFFAGKTSTQIADKLHIPAGTVKSRLYYGLRNLRAALEERGILQ